MSTSNLLLDIIFLGSLINSSHGGAAAATVAAAAIVAGITAATENNDNENYIFGLPLVLLLAPIFFAISFFYSSVGFGGGSSYMAILVLAGISLFAVPPIALILNIVAASLALTNYTRAGHISIKFALPFLSSVPFAFLAGMAVLPQQTLVLVFAAALFAASAALFVSSQMKNKEGDLLLHHKIAKTLWMLGKQRGVAAIYHDDSTYHSANNKNRQRHPYQYQQRWSLRLVLLIGLPIGAVLGTIAGLVGIGGGIWLSPLLILTGLADPKKAAATASLFILANSISGFIAHSITKPIDTTLLFPLALAVIAGSFTGSRLGAFKFNHDNIRRIVACLVAIAGVIIILKFLL